MLAHYAVVQTRSVVGVKAKPVAVEVHLSAGLPKFAIVGLAETAVKESKDRVRSAIINSHFEFPCRNITVNLAPAILPKSGSGFDLPIAVGILAASQQISAELLSAHEFMAELALDGSLRAVAGIIPAVIAAKQQDKILIISQDNAAEAALIAYDKVLVAANLSLVCSYLSTHSPLDCVVPAKYDAQATNVLDLADVKGQKHAKYALEIAAAGGHSMLFNGPPGSGKSMLAHRLPGILPDLSEAEALDAAAIYSLRGNILDFKAWRERPFRAPHHTASYVALVGGGNPPKPGEVSMAHHGVLFLDEIPEFSRQVLETLREPLDSGVVNIVRASQSLELPAVFQLIAAMNPCPCGQFGNPNAQCLCSPDRIMRYIAKLSAPFLDRIDMYVHLQALSETELVHSKPADSSETLKVRARVSSARVLQISRQGCLNAALSSKNAESLCKLGVQEQEFLCNILSKNKLSARGFHRMLKVARTIADLAEHDAVVLADLQRAFSFRHNLQLPL
jgi:magnesium chelatase family protein